MDVKNKEQFMKETTCKAVWHLKIKLVCSMI